MRIVISLLFVTILFLGGIFLDRRDHGEVHPASFLPSDTIFYFDQKNSSSAMERMLNSRLARALRTLEVKKTLAEAQINYPYGGVIDSSIAQFDSFLRSGTVKFLLGERCTAAIYGQRDWAGSASDLTTYLSQHLLIISKRSETMGSDDEILAGDNGISLLSNVAYGRYTIKRVQLESLQQAAVAFVDDVVLFAPEERVMREALDLYDKKVATLRRSTHFLKVQRELDNAERTLYIDAQAIRKFAAATRGTSSQPDVVSGSLSLANNIGVLAYGEWRQKKVLHNRLLLELATDQVAPQIQQLVATQPSLNDTLPYAARDSLLYYWSNSLDLGLIWQMYKGYAGTESDEVVELQKAIFNMTGYEPEQLIQMIGSNVALMLGDSNAHFMPMPDFAILLKVNDRKKAAIALSKILYTLGINTNQGRYKYVDYFAWGLDPSESLQPVYAIHRDYLIIANTLDMLKNVVDTPINNTRLVTGKNFRELDPGFQTLNNSVCFIDQNRLLTSIHELIGWAGTILAIQDRQAAEKTKLLIDKLIDPLFWGLGMYEKSAIRTYVEGPLIFIEAKTRITH